MGRHSPLCQPWCRLHGAFFLTFIFQALQSPPRFNRAQSPWAPGMTYLSCDPKAMSISQAHFNNNRSEEHIPTVPPATSLSM